MFKGGMGDLMKQAQKMQEQMQKAQEELAHLEVTGESGAGMVKITMNGRYDVKRVFLEPDLLKEEKEVVEDLIAAAINGATKKIEENNKNQMSGLTAGLNLPPGFKLPF